MKQGLPSMSDRIFELLKDYKEASKSDWTAFAVQQFFRKLRKIVRMYQ